MCGFSFCSYHPRVMKTLTPIKTLCLLLPKNLFLRKLFSHLLSPRYLLLRSLPREPKNPKGLLCVLLKNHLLLLISSYGLLLSFIGPPGEATSVFVREWIATCGLPPSKDLRNAALNAWMENPGARLMACRQGIQV